MVSRERLCQLKRQGVTEAVSEDQLVPGPVELLGNALLHIDIT